jgi:hypothetical protein
MYLVNCDFYGAFAKKVCQEMFSNVHARERTNAAVAWDLDVTRCSWCVVCDIVSVIAAKNRISPVTMRQEGHGKEDYMAASQTIVLDHVSRTSLRL